MRFQLFATIGTPGAQLMNPSFPDTEDGANLRRGARKATENFRMLLTVGNLLKLVGLKSRIYADRNFPWVSSAPS